MKNGHLGIGSSDLDRKNSELGICETMWWSAQKCQCCFCNLSKFSSEMLGIPENVINKHFENSFTNLYHQDLLINMAIDLNLFRTNY